MTSWTILHVNTERGWRGGEAQTLLLARGLQRRGHRCSVATPPGAPLEGRAARAGLETLPLEARGELDPRGVARLAGLLRRHRPEIVHYHTSHAITLGTLASYRAGRRIAVASRRVSFPLARNPLARLKYTHRVDRIIAVSEGIRETLLAAGVPGHRVSVIPSAVDLERLGGPADRDAARARLGVGTGDFLVGAVGHLAPHKGHSVLVEAAALASPREPKLRFLLVGRGELEDELRSRISAASLSPVFRQVGFHEDVGAILPALDLLAFPSLSGEGSPAAPKEAMACGIPVVASDISGIREIVRPGLEGLLVRPGDPAALAEAILGLARSPDLRLEFAARGRERSLLFGLDHLVERTESLYRDLIEDRRP